ncbi:WavQ [Sulfurimonas xiamenensis]|uniref:Glycosyltransferase family 61 protein n=1 Tax=Sulfurimonas xiamenensis TaxID=2590021 RepID=A0AAJ4A2C0_9BACT|nr:WavQ [Sulfurimonas xiamenensis]QFR42553.1 glycosyltransferase family 61 protein [Sulfurimonas xiamenensis]
MEYKKLKFIVYAPPFNENSGGVMALHKLCDLLNESEETAYLYLEFRKPLITDHESLLMKILYPLRLFKYYFLKFVPTSYGKNLFLNTPRIIYGIKKNIDNTVVIYPEIVSGNPLEVKNVVRWLLHKPGFHTGEINYGKSDIYFFYQVIFNDPTINPYDDHLLSVLWVRDDIYKKTNFGERKGICYMLRKGKNRKITHDTENSILLDGKSHGEVAKVMNECEYFISYDMETMYSQYAVLCGCKSIVIPEKGVSKDEWQPKKEFQYGIAYGFDDIEEAEKTKHLVYDVLKKIEDESNQSVSKFVNRIYTLVGKN